MACNVLRSGRILIDFTQNRTALYSTRLKSPMVRVTMVAGSDNGDGCNSTYEAEHKRLLECYSRITMLPSQPRFENFMKLKLRPSDVILLSPLKCGSTWTQQVMHGVRTRGDMGFNGINDMIPVLEFALDDGYDIHGDQPSSPRCFKTHTIWENRPKGHKYITIVRDPKDALVSLYDFFRGWIVPQDTRIDVFAKVFALDHLESAIVPTNDAIASWWPHRSDPNTLWLHYEDLKEDLPSAVQLIAKFMGFDAQDTELVDIVTKQASYEFMKAHDAKFRTEARGIGNMDVGPSRVNKGKLNRKILLPEATLMGMDADWRKVVQPVTGFLSYSEMRDHINREMGRPWAAQK